MANLGDVFLRLLLDDSDFEKQVVAKAQKAGNKAGLSMGAQMAAGLSSGANQLGKTLASVGQNLTKTGSAMTRNLTLPILAAGAAVSHFALDFDTALRRTVALSDVTAAEIGGIREQILKLGPEIGKSPQELAEAFYFIASAGFKAEEAMKVLDIAARASATGMGQTQDIAKVLAGTINAYGHENLTAARAGDILTAAVADGAAEASDFAGVIGRIVPVAAALGVSFDQVTAALAGMTLVGVSADEAATSLVQIFSALLKPTTQAEDAMKGLGLSSAGLRTELREKGLLDTLRTLEARFAGNETASSLVFGNIRALRGITALLTLDEGQLNKVFADTNAALGNLAAGYQETAGPQRKLDQAMADLQASAIELGTDVLPQLVGVVQEIADGVRRLARWWKSLDADTRKQIVQWLAWIAVAGPALLILGKLASGAGALFKAVGFLAGAKGIPALATAAGRARLVMFGWLGVILLVSEGLNALTPAVSDFFDTLVSGKKANKVLHELNDLTGDMFKAQVLRAWGVSVKQFSKVVEAAGGDVNAAFDAIKDNAGDLGKTLDQLSQDADPGSLFAGWGTRDPTKIAAALEKGRRIAAEKAGEIPQVISAALVDGQWQVDQAAEAIPDPVVEALEKAKQDVADAANDLLHTLATTLSSSPQELLDAAQAMWEDILHPFPDVKHKLVILAILARKDWITGLTSPDSGDRARTAEYLKGILTEFEELAPGVLASGEGIPPALQAGIDRTLDALTTYLKTNVVGDILDPFDLADELDRMGYDGLAGYVHGLERSRIDKLQTVGGRILRETKIALYDDFYQEGYDAASSYGAGLNAGGQKAITYVQNFTGKIAAMLKFAGSPDYTHSREFGVGAIRSYVAGALAEARARLPALAATMAGSLAFAPGFGGVSVPSIGGMAAAAGTVGAGSGATVNNFNLTVAGERPVVSTAREIAQEGARLASFGGNMSGR